MIKFSKYKTLSKYLFSTLLSLPVSLITGFITFKVIDPYYLGVWNTIIVFEVYFTFLRLGIINGLNRELPYALGQNKVTEATKFAETAFAFTIYDIVGAVIIIPFMLLFIEFSTIYIPVIVVFLIRITFNYYITYLTGTFRSDDNFDKLSSIQFIMLTLRLFVSPLLLLGFYGYLMIEVILVIINASLLHYYRPFKVKPKFDTNIFKRLLKIGMPFFITTSLINVIDTFPRLYIIRFGDEKLLGLYAPILMLLNTIALFPNTLSTYIYPKFSYKLAKEKHPHNIWKQLKIIYTISFIFILVLISGAYLLLDYFVLFFPKYSESLPYLKISLIICPFVIYKTGNLLNAVLKNIRFMIYFVVLYAVIQLITLIFISNYFNDILSIVIYSQIITNILLFISVFMMNYILINKYRYEP